MIIHPSRNRSGEQIRQYEDVDDPDTNQDKDAWKIQYRQYYDAFVAGKQSQRYLQPYQGQLRRLVMIKLKKPECCRKRSVSSEQDAGLYKRAGFKEVKEDEKDRKSPF